MVDPLDDPDTMAALRLIADVAASKPDLCPACMNRPTRAGESFCGPCTDERAEMSKQAKRDWWARRGAYAGTPRQRAKTWLKSQLRRGPIESQNLRSRAKRDGISDRTLRRAAKEVGVVVSRRGQGRDHVSVWSLPPSQGRGSSHAHSRPPGHE